MLVSGMQTTLFEVEVFKQSELSVLQPLLLCKDIDIGLDLFLSTQRDYHIVQEHKIIHHERKAHACRNGLHKSLGYSHLYYSSSCENSNILLMYFTLNSFSFYTAMMIFYSTIITAISVDRFLTCIRLHDPSYHSPKRI